MVVRLHSNSFKQFMAILKSREEIEIMAEAGAKLGKILAELRAQVRPGRSAQFFEDLSRKLIKESGTEPVFLGYQPAGARVPYPAALCLGVNDAVVHTPPSKEVILKEGDVVKLDLGLRHKGLCVDSAITVAVGRVSPEAIRLIEITEEALRQAIQIAIPGNTLGDIGHTVEACVTSAGFSIVKSLTGHGIGEELHEEPSVFNFGKPGQGMTLKPGLVIAIEPITAIGSGKIKQVSDDSYVTADGSLSAHFEHTIAITEEGPKILTAAG